MPFRLEYTQKQNAHFENCDVMSTEVSRRDQSLVWQLSSIVSRRHTLRHVVRGWCPHLAQLAQNDVKR